MLTVTRMDLDGSTSPTALVTKILKAEPGLTLPIPIEQIARQLDIADIRELAADGFVGGLITDTSRSDGFILVKQGLIEERRRFTIGHELGHFLMVHHRPPATGFQCSAVDMNRRAVRKEELPPAQRWEVEANEFASLMLMPPPMWRREAGCYRDPDLAQIAPLAKAFGVSREAAARTYVTYHEQSVAIALVKDGRIERIYRPTSSAFPALSIKPGDPVPPSSVFHRAKQVLVQPSDMVEANAAGWVQSEWGRRMPDLSEQVLFRQNGYAFILLWSDTVADDDYDPDEDRTSKQRLADRQARYAR